MLTNDFSNYIDADDEEIEIEISNFNNSAKVLLFCNKLHRAWQTMSLEGKSVAACFCSIFLPF